MSEQLHIRYHKWMKDEYKSFFKNIRDHLSMISLQFYMPLFSLYFYIHNTPNSHKTIDFERRYYMREITEITKQRYYNSNILALAKIYDSGKQCYETREVFGKTLPLLDPMHCINNNYTTRYRRNPKLPSGYGRNTYDKVNDMNNTAYIDVFCSYVCGQLTFLKKNPSFPLFYGSLNGIGDYKYDISEEYYDMRTDKSFTDNLGKTFTLDMYMDSDSESKKSSTKSHNSEESLEELGTAAYNSGQYKSSSSSSSSDSDYQDDYIAIIKKIPLQLLFIEKLEATLEDYLDDSEFEENVLMSCLFQISFALAYLQKRYEFTHNDLHINNVMYTTTETQYLYYKLNNMYFRVPTYGKIFKIIDFGRAIFTFKNKVYKNDVFSRNGEAGGQYSYPHQVSFLKDKVNDRYNKIGEPNYNFDLCRLSMTILEEIQRDKLSNDMYEFLSGMCRTSQGKDFCKMSDDFSLYISIARDADKALPLANLCHVMFKPYRVQKKKFPKKSYYTL